MSLTVDGIWKAGVWATTVWASGVWSEGVVVEVEDTHDGGEEAAKKFREKKEKMREMIAFAYDKTHGLLPIAEEVKEIIEPHVEAQTLEIDWESVSQKSVERLLKAQEKYEKYMQDLDDEEAMMVLH